MSDGNGSVVAVDSEEEEWAKFEAFMAGKCFLPILQKLHDFEADVKKLLHEESAILDGNPLEWAFNSFLAASKYDRDCLDLANPEKMNALVVGNMVAAKWVYFEAVGRMETRPGSLYLCGF
jgi:hypothetical protein